MYKITREEAANLLNMSTRSIDRYIRAWKLRSKKDWKIVYIHEDDINNFLWNWQTKQEVIISWNIKTENSNEITISKTKNENSINIIFDQLRQEIKQKDEEIKDMSQKIWKMEEVIKNSISIIEFKKSQFLLEESKTSITTDLENTKKELDLKNIMLKEEKKLNIILLIVLLALFAWIVIIWLVKI